MSDTAAPPAFQALDEIAGAHKRVQIPVEHMIQRHAKLWVRDAVAVNHKFFAFDRSKGAGQWSHAREKARGMQKATPDTLLRVVAMVPIWCEFKRPGKKPDDDQYAMGAELRRLGDEWFWAVSVEGYWRQLKAIGVPLRPNAEFLALHHDARVASSIAEAELKAGRLPKSMRVAKPRPSARQIAASHRAYAIQLGLTRG